MPNNLLSVYEASKLLKVSTKTIRRWEESGKLVGLRTSGGHRRYTLGQLESFKSGQKEVKVEKVHAVSTPLNLDRFSAHNDNPKSVRDFFNPLSKVSIPSTPKLQSPARNIPISNFARVVLSSFFSLSFLFSTFIVNQSFVQVEGEKIFKNTSVAPIEKVLAATSLQNLKFNVNMASTFSADAFFKGNVLTGDLTPANIDLVGSDLFVSGDIENAGVIYSPQAVISGDTSVGSLTINSETVTSLTGPGLIVADGELQTVIGDGVESEEITDGTIEAVDLNVSEDPEDNQILSYDSSTGAFTWASDQTGGGSLFTDGGSITYLTSTTDDFALGGSTSGSPLFFDVSTGNLTISGSFTVGSDTLSDFTGSGLTNTSGALTVATITATDALSTTTTNGSGLEVFSTGISLLQGCSNSQILKWNEGTDSWECGAVTAVVNVESSDVAVGVSVDTLDFSTDFAVTASPANEANISVADDILNFTELSDTLTLDAATTITNSLSGNLIIDLTGTGDFVISDSGTPFFTFTDAGALTQAGSGLVTFTGNVDATSGLDVTGANLTIGTTQFTVDVSNGNTTTAGDLAVNGGDVTSSGDLTLTLAGGDLFLANTNTFNVGGNATDVAYNVIGDTTSGAGNVDSDDDLYVEGNLEVDGSIFGGGVDITSFACPDCIDFDDIEDTMDLDAALILNQGTSTWTQNFTGTGTTGLTHNANSLTTGSALNITSSSNPGAAGPVSPVQFNLTSTNSGIATTFNGVDIGFTSNPGIAGNTEHILQVQNEVTSNTTDNIVTALVRLDNADTSAAGSTVATNGLLITNSGDISGGIVNAINIDDSDITTDIVLQNDETIDNNTDGTITLTAPITSLSGDLAIAGGNITTGVTFDSTLTVTGAFSANEAANFTPSGTTDITFNVDTDSLLTLDSSVTNGDNLVISPNNTGAGSTFTGTLTTANLTADRTITIPDATGDVCLSSGNCAGGAGGSKWTDSGSTVYLTDTGDELVLGGSSPLSSSKFSIDGDADQIQLTLQGNGTQTANLFVVESSGGTDFFAVEDLGGLAVSPSSTDDVTFTTDADSTIVISGLSAGSGTALCLDGSNNIVTCSAGSSSATLQSAYDADTNGSDTLITLSTSDDSLIFRNPAGSGTDSAFNLQVDNIGAGLTTANFKNLNVTEAGSFDTTGSSLTNYGGYFSNTSGESAGGNVLTNVGLYATASGGDANYSGVFESGNVGIGDTSPTSLLTVGASDAFQVNSSGNIVSIGAAAHTIANSSGNLLITPATSGNVTLGTTTTTSGTTIQSGTGDITFASQDDFIFTPIDGSEIDITAVASTTLEGVVDLNVDTSVTGGFEILNQSLTVNNGATGGDDFTSELITLTANDADADLFGIQIVSAGTANAGAGSYEALIRLDNAENTAGAVTDGLLITSSSATDTDITDAIDVSHANIVNAINIGANVLIGTTANIDLTNFDVTGSSGDLTTAGDITINGGDITTSGDLTITPAGGDLFLGNATTLNIGGNATDIAYNIIGDNNTNASGSVGSDDDLYIEGFLEVDGGVGFTPDSTNDVSIVTDADSTLNITGLSSSTGSALCLDGSSNLVTCTVGAGGISGSGTAGQIAFFDTSTSISSESAGFGWDATNNLFTLTGGTGNTTQTVQTISQSAQGLTSGGLFNAALSSTSATASFTGDIGAISSNRDNDTGSQTLTDTGNLFDLSRTTTTNNASATTNVTGALANITNIVTATLGTINDSASLLSITQDADVTGALLYLNTNRSSTATALLVEQSAGGTDALLLQDNGNLTIGGDLAITGGNITTAFTADSTVTVTGTLTANGTLDSNGDVTIADTNVAFDGASTIFTTTGAFTLTPGGAVLIGDGGDTLQINSSDWDVSVTGDLTGIGAITADGAISTTSTLNVDSTSTLNTVTLDANSDLTFTAGTGSLVINNSVSNASEQVLDVNPAFAGGATDALTYSVLDIAGFSPSNAAGTDSVRGINIGDLTDPGSTITSSAIRIGTGWDDVLNYNGTTVINGTGQIVSTQVTGTLFTLAGDSGSGTIVQGDTATIAGGTNLTSAHSGDTVTINLDDSITLVGDIAVNGDDITSDGATLVINAGGTVDIQDALTVDSIDVGGAEAFAIGNTNATSVSICNSTACDTLSLGTNADADTINIGDNSDTFVIDTSAFDVSSGQISGATNETINGIDISAGAVSDVVDLDVIITDGSTATIDGDGSPTTDILAVSVSETSATDGIDALQLTFGVSAASGNIIDITPSYADATAGATSETYNAIDIDAFTATQNASGDTGLIRGLNIGNLTQTETAGTLTANAIKIGTGWDSVLDVNGTTVINATGQLVTTQLTGTLFSITGGGTETIEQGNTITYGDTTTIGLTVAATDTVTADVNANSLDFTSLEPSLDVDTATDINLGANALTIDLDSTGDFSIRDVATAFVTFNENNSGQVVLADGSFLDLGAITHDDSTIQGLRLPQNTTLTNMGSEEGFLAWDTDGNALYAYNGATWQNVSGASTTLQEAYDNDVNGSDTLITLNTTDGSVIIKPIAGTSFQVEQVTSAPTTDIVSITNTGLGTITDGVDGLSLTFVTGDGSSVTNNALNIAVTPGGSISADIVNGVNIANITATGSTETGLLIGTGWDTGISLTPSIGSEAIDISTVAGIRTVSPIDINENNTSGTVPTIQWDSAETRGGLLDANLTGALVTENFVDITTSAAFTSNILDINLTGAGSGNVLDITTSSSATSSNLVDLNFGAVTDTGDAINISMGAAAVGAQGLVMSTSAGIRTQSAISITENNTTGTVASFLYTDNASATRGGFADWNLTGALATENFIDIDTSAAWTSNLFDITSGAQAATGNYFDVNVGNAAQTGDIFNVDIAASAVALQRDVTTNAAISSTSGWLQQVTTSAAWTGNMVDITTGAQAWTGNMYDINVGAAASTGDIMNISMGSSNLAGGAFVIADAGGARTDALIDISSASTGSASDAAAIFQINASGALNASANVMDFNISGGPASNVIDITTSASASSGNLIDLNFGNIADTGNAIDISMGAAAVNAKGINISTAAGVRTDNAIAITENNTSGTVPSIQWDSAETGGGFLDANLTGALTTQNFIDITASAAFTSNLIDLNVTGNIIAANILDISLTSTALTTGRIANLDWSPASTTTATGDLFRLNIGPNGNVGNLFNITDNTSSLFSVSETQITSALPHSFTAAGDVNIAYDLIFTNQTSSIIDSYGPLTIRSGEIFENNDLTLATYGTGNVILDPSATGYIQLEGATRFNSQVTLANDATPDVSSGTWFVTGGTTTITDFDAGSGTLEDGHIVYIESAHAVTIDCDETNAEMECGTDDIILASGDIISFIYDAAADNWDLISWFDQGDVQTGADIAEYFPSNQNLLTGEVVKVDPQNAEHVIRSESAYESQVVGIVSTDPGIILGENIPGSFAIALAGRVPVKISASSQNIIPGDYITTSSEPGKATKAVGNGRVIGQALEGWTSGSSDQDIIVFINNTWYEPVQIALEDSGSVGLAEDPGNPEFALLTDSEGNVINKLSGLVGLIAQNIKSDFADITNLVSNNINTSTIEPLDDENSITINIGEQSGGQSGFGKLLVRNSEGEEVASIDEEGNATFAGQVTSNTLEVAEDATIGGELRVGRIIADEIVAGNALFADTLSNTYSGITRQEIEALLNESEGSQTILGDLESWSVDTESGFASLSELYLENLYVTGTAAFNSLSLTEAVVIGNDLAISSTINNQGLVSNSIDTIDNPLLIQSSGTQPIHLMAGLVSIDTSGNVNIEGNLAVKGAIESSSLRVTESGFGKLLTFVDEEGSEVAGVSSTGEAEFASLETSKIAVKDDPNQTSTTVSGGLVFTSSASIGSAKVPANASEVTIENPNVNAGSLIFATVTSQSSQPIFIKSQGLDEFVVGFSSPVTSDVTFNWWIVGVGQ